MFEVALHPPDFHSVPFVKNCIIIVSAIVVPDTPPVFV